MPVRITVEDGLTVGSPVFEGFLGHQVILVRHRPPYIPEGTETADQIADVAHILFPGHVAEAPPVIGMQYD